jgi:RimJ/RimL family protein N-acetyltransferase
MRPVTRLPQDFSVETERLVLRRFRNDDLDVVSAMQADALTMQYVGNGRPKDRAQSRATLEWIADHWDQLGYGLLAIAEKEGGSTLGWAGFIDPPEWPDFELGWALCRSSWGKGYATEAARALLEVARTDLARETVISMIRRANTESSRIAQKIGLRFDVEGTLFDMPIDIYRIRFP